MQRPRGFTLLEVLVVIAVLGILLTIGVITITSWRNSSLINQAATDLAQALGRERTEAKRLNESRKVILTSTGLTVTRYSATGTASAGRTVVLPNAVTLSTPTTAFFYVQPYGEARTVNTTNPARPSGDIPAGFSITLTGNTKTRIVRVSGVFGRAILK